MTPGRWLQTAQAWGKPAALRCVVLLCLALGFALWRTADAAQTLAPRNSWRCDASFGREIPVYAWQARSDWINVRATTGAKGDGKADDSAAVQAALDQLGASPGLPKVVYFPPGRYLLKRTLVIRNLNGAMLIGHGHDTVIVWDGERDGRMLWSDGAARTTYLGLVFDGAKRAGVGIDHDSKERYETRVRHESLEFRDFRIAGIRVGADQKVASAEMMFYNLVFRNNAAGVQFLAWNDYNNVFDGCLFEDNGYGIFAEKGNVVVRNSRFERSRISDALLTTHSHSFRRVLSLESNRFIETVKGPTASGNIKVQSSRIEGWRSSEGAIVSYLRGPLLVFDTVFGRPPKNGGAPIRLANPPYMRQDAIISNVEIAPKGPIVDEGSKGFVRVLPPVESAWLPARDTQFLRSTVKLADRVIDAKRDCQAKGDGRSNDSRYLQACIDRATKAGPGTYLYLPSGIYRTSRTLQIDGAGFELGGTGWHSQIVRSGIGKGPVISVTNPKGLVLEHMAVAARSGGDSLVQTGTQPGSIFYRGVYGFDRDETEKQTIRLRGLPAGMLVQSDHLDGRVRIEDSGAATILLGFLASVKLDVLGRTPPDGFLGLTFRVSALEEFPLTVGDNQSLVQSDWYNEQTHYLFEARGGERPFGRLTLDLSRAEAQRQNFGFLRDYRGRLALLGGNFGIPEDKFTPTLAVKGGDSSVTLMANAFWNEEPAAEVSAESQFFAANVITGRTLNPFLVGQEESGARAAAIEALNDLRELSDLDASYNQCRLSRP